MNRFQRHRRGNVKGNLNKLEGGAPSSRLRQWGMGLGLPICRRMVEAQGGKIQVKSTIKEGTVVTVIISVEPKTERTREENWIIKQGDGALVFSGV
ncbi:MAG: ATP-binding protein [Candidatus Bathyarchaeia archaeon]